MVVMAPVKKLKNTMPFQRKAHIELEVGEMNEDEVSQDVKIIAQEVQIVKSLACNDITQRNRQMRRLRKWLQIRTTSSFPFSQEDFMRIWKGLYYNMWYSDKPLVQEELAEQLGRLLECFDGNLQYSVDFFGAFLKTMCIEWFGIDQWRIDKFLMLTRRMLRYMFKSLKSSDWSLDGIELFNKHATETVLFENVSAKGLTMHYFDIFFEELAKVSDGSTSAVHVGMFVKPFVKFMATQRDFNLLSHCRTRVFDHLLYQSALGREYVDKYNAWKDMGFPTKHIDELEKVEESENTNDIEEESGDCTKHLDPRAGNVDVFMPELQVEAQPIIKEIEHFLYKEDCPTKRRKLLKSLLALFSSYEKGKFPLGIKTMPRFEGKSEKPLINEKIRQLDNLENELFGVDRKLKQMTKRKRRKFLKTLNFDEIDESNYEQTLEKALPRDYFRERRKRSQKSFMSGWIEEKLDEDDLKPKKAFNVKSITKDIDSEGKTQIKKNKLKQNLKINESIEISQKLNQQEKLMSRTKTEDSNIKFSKKIKKNDVDFKEDKINEEENKSGNTQTKCLKISDPQEKEFRVLKISDSDEVPTKKSKRKATNEWDEPLGDGEVEYFIPSRKIQIRNANDDLVLNPLAKKRLSNNQSTPATSQITYFSANSTPKTPSSVKRVKIALKHNTSQNPIEYIQQIKSSPNIPYDAKRKPGKGLLKPNAVPSPINPFYKKKIGLKLLNDTI